MTDAPSLPKPGRLVLDFSQPMRPKERHRMKIIPGHEKPPSGGSLAFPNRRELYELTPAERGERSWK